MGTEKITTTVEQDNNDQILEELEYIKKQLAEIKGENKKNKIGLPKTIFGDYENKQKTEETDDVHKLQEQLENTKRQFAKIKGELDDTRRQLDEIKGENGIDYLV